MSDMSRPGPRLLAAPDHDRHDALLVAQFVAGDPLKPEQRAQAHDLVIRCGACAALAADLPAVSRAVAHEPVPPRRRDFRLTPEMADELRGNALTRFLRGLSLPSSRAFQPAAAGVLSIGLLFVVAGYAWPDGGTVTVQAEPNLVDWSSAAPSATELETRPAPALVSEPGSEEDAPLVGADRVMEDDEFADSLSRSQAGLAQESLQQSQPKEADTSVADDAAKADATEAGAAEALRMEAYSLASEPEVAELDTTAETPQQPAGADGDTGLEQRVQDRAADASEASLEGTQDSSPVEGTQSSLAASETVTAAGDGPEELLIVLGLALALGGGGLLLLGWLARRARDPLAP